MNRRVFLGSVGSLASVGTLAFVSRDPVERLEVRFWLSPRAGRYGDVPGRIRGYLRRALSIGAWEVDIEYGGVVDVETEDGADVTRAGEWPRLLAAGTLGRENIEVAEHVNLLVTDGQMQTKPTGYGMAHVASVGGARDIARIQPVDPERVVYEYSPPNRVMQVLIHEVGHALGLRHGHGVAYDRRNAIVVTPMLSTYAFDSSYERDASKCGHQYPPIPDHADRRLQLTYSACARDRLASYRGGVVP